MDGLAGSIPALDSDISVDQTDHRTILAARGGPGRSLSPLAVSATAKAADAVCLFLAAAWTWHDSFDAEVLQRHARLSIVIGCVVTMIGLARGGYPIAALRSRSWHVRTIIGALGAGLVAAAACVVGLQGGDPFRSDWLWSWFITLAVLIVAWRAVLLGLVGMLDSAGALSRRMMIVGSPDLGKRVAARAASAAADWCVLGVYDDTAVLAPDGARRGTDIGVDLIEHCRRNRIDAVVIALRPTEVDRIAALRRWFAVTVADVYWSADFPESADVKAVAADLPIGPALLVRRRPLADRERVQKRLFDVALASVLLVLLSPLMVVTALAIKLTSPGPVLFRQPRIGFNHQMLEIRKFRTMYHHHADLLADEQTTRNDRRVTPVGRWLRRLSLDELPQLFNVLGGSMSLVGPRPHAPNTKAGGRLFADLVADYAMRHRVKPGITGWAQVNGWRGETQTVDQIENRVMYDLHYIDNWTLLLDVKIVLMTVLGGFLSSRAY